MRVKGERYAGMLSIWRYIWNASTMLVCIVRLFRSEVQSAKCIMYLHYIKCKVQSAQDVSFRLKIFEVQSAKCKDFPHILKVQSAECNWALHSALFFIALLSKLHFGPASLYIYTIYTQAYIYIYIWIIKIYKLMYIIHIYVYIYI